MSDHEDRVQRVRRSNAAEPVGGAGKPEGRPPEAVPAEPTGSDRSEINPPRRRRRGKQLTKDPGAKRMHYSGEQRLLILDVWRRSSLPAADFAPDEVDRIAQAAGRVT